MDRIWETHLGKEVPYDVQYHDNVRLEIASFISEPPGLILDIGCGAGAAGKVIKKKFPGARVIGIERNPWAADLARTALDEVICADLHDVDLRSRLGSVRVDLVLLLDILEHLYDPWRTLLRIRDWLEPGTRVLASAPNVRNLETLDALASGHWDYAANGVLDITHLRFFTKPSFRRLFEETGYRVLDVTPLLRTEPIDLHVVSRRPGRIATRNVSIAVRDLDDLEDLYAMQYLIDARVADAIAPAPTAEPPD